MSLEFTEQELLNIRATFCPGFTDQQFGVCMTFCRVRNLLPGKHVVFQLRSSKEWDEAARAKVPTTKIIFITTIDASRLIAQRTGQYGGQLPEQYIYLDADGSPSILSEIPLPKLPLPENGLTALPREPWAVKTIVIRKDFSQPISSIARFDAYASTYNTTNGPQLNEMWARRGPEQLAKCSEMLSLRKAFPEELGSLYIAEEFKQEHEEVINQAVSPAVAVTLPPPVPAVNQTPAIPTEAARPNENQKPTESEVSKPQTPATESAKDKALAAVPDLKPASALPEPKKKTGRPKKTSESPVNGQPPVEGITDEDIATAGNPGPEFDHEENKRVVQELIESITSFTPSEAEAQGLPDPGKNAIPEGKVRDGFVTRMRGIVCPGVDIKSLGDYTLSLGQKTSSKFLTVGDWEKALGILEAAKTESIEKLKEVLKNAPLPPF